MFQLNKIFDRTNLGGNPKDVLFEDFCRTRALFSWLYNTCSYIAYYANNVSQLTPATFSEECETN